MTTTHPTEAQLKKFLVEDNDWTEEEFDQFTGYYFRYINADGATFLSYDEWEKLALRF